jgi:hypothetical protein
VYPSTLQIARFLHWGMRKAPAAEMREMSRALLASSVRTVLKGTRPL